MTVQEPPDEEFNLSALRSDSMEEARMRCKLIEKLGTADGSDLPGHRPETIIPDVQ
jgi:hypothetical protein